jgi:hypothetical protein
LWYIEKKLRVDTPAEACCRSFKGRAIVTEKAKTKRTARKEQPKRVELGSDALPRRTLRDVESVAEALRREYASKGASWEELASVLKIGRKTNSTKYLFWSAQAYGVITKDGNAYSLSELGRKIVAPTYDGEEREARIKALLTPSLLSKFYTDYNGHPIPSPQYFPNVLETRYQIPRERVEEATRIILDNAEHAGILQNLPDGSQQINLSGLGIAPPPAFSGLEEDEANISHQQVSQLAQDWNKVVFVITPIGDEGTDVRRHADMMLKHLLEPILAEFSMIVIRADRIEKSGLITKQVFEHLAYARLCIADLSFNNPNAFYELGVRHMTKRPTIQMIRKNDRIPFDVAQGRTIMVDTSDVYTVMDRMESAKRELKEHVKNALSPGSEKVADDNPVQTYLPNLRVTLDGSS